MRIALLYFGRAKGFERTHPSLIHAIGSSHTVDVFYSSDNEPAVILQQFIDVCNPISTVNDKIECDIDFTHYPKTNPKIGYYNYYSLPRHFINKKRVFSLLEAHIQQTNISYDAVISARLDIPIDTLIVPTPAPNTLYIPEGYDYHGINDRFAIGDVEAMKKYMMIFDSTLHLLDSQLSVVHPESLTLANIKYRELHVVRFKLSTKIVR